MLWVPLWKVQLYTKWAWNLRHMLLSSLLECLLQPQFNSFPYPKKLRPPQCLLSCLTYMLVVVQLCQSLCNPMNYSTPGFPVLHHFPEFAQTHVHWVSDAIQSSHLLLLPSPPILNLSQRQGLFQWVISSYQVAKVLEFQLRHQSFQRIFRVDFL